MADKRIDEYLQRGQFHRAVQAYESAGDLAHANIASLACAQDCLEVGLYEKSVEYFDRGGRKEMSLELERILKDNNLFTRCHYSSRFSHLTNSDIMVFNSERIEPTHRGVKMISHYGCSCNQYLISSLDDFVGSERENFLRFAGYVQKEDFIGRAEALKNGR